MDQAKLISGNKEKIWQQVNDDLSKDNGEIDYHAVLELSQSKIMLDIVFDPGGGFESGYEFTSFTGIIKQQNDFRFALHHESFADKLGKLVGMEDVVLGYPEFDKEIIVKTNDAAKVKAIFAHSDIRKIFQSLKNFSLHIVHHHISGKEEKQPFLELEIQEAIIDPQNLQTIGNAFFCVHSMIDGERIELS